MTLFCLKRGFIPSGEVELCHGNDLLQFRQETFLQLYRCLHAGQSIGNARAWIFRVAHNLAVNQIKSQQFITPIDDDTWAEVRRLYQDSSPTPEQKLIQQEKFERLRIAVASLT